MSDGWTNRQVQANPQAYLRWQEEQRTKVARARKEAEEESDFQQFRSMFIERGGDPSKAREWYSKYRNDRALEEAARHDQATRERLRAERSRAV